MPRILHTIAFAALGLLPSAVYASKVKVWHHHLPGQFDRAQLKQAVVSSEGRLRLSRMLKPLAGIDAAHIWDIAENKNGDLYVATGDDGRLYHVNDQGKVSLLYTSEDSQILSLALASDGTLFAGTGPNGNIVRIDAAGTAKVLYHGSESYVWSLALSSDGTLYAGTGPQGRILRITPGGQATVFYTTKQKHVLCLALSSEGTLYAGGDKSGLIYRIDPQGKGFVLLSAPQAEIRSLLATPEGIYAATSSPTHRRLSSSRSSGSSDLASDSAAMMAATGVSAPKNTQTSKETKTKVSSDSSPKYADRKERTNFTAASAPSPPSVGENSLYRIASDGTVRELFREKVLMLSVLRHRGHLFVGTGMDGQLFEVDEATKERSEIARLDHGQILCLRQLRNGSVVLGTGDPGKLYILQDKYVARGTVISQVLDAKLISKWGALRWQADTPAGTSVSVAVRSGNVAEPDETWSDWSAEQTDPERAVIAAPAARFLQYRLTLATESPSRSPALRDLTLRYLNTNQPPELTALETPNLDAASLDNPKRVRFHWSATDPNEDELSYNLYIRKDGWKNWILLEENYDKKEYDWDTTSTPSGIYQLKVVASDRRDNDEKEALIDERISDTFVVSHIPPKVSIKIAGMDGDRAILEATATDPWVRLTSAAFALNGKNWTPIFPTDGLFDNKTETFRFKTEALKPGTYVVVLRVQDAAGNTGSQDVVFDVEVRSPQR